VTEQTDTAGNPTASGEAADATGADRDSASSESDSVAEQDPLAVARSHPVLLFDGVCNLCNRWVQFVIERDPEAQFRFAPLQSTAAQRLLADCGYEGETLDSVVLVEDGTYYTKSDAVIRTAYHLGGVYRLLEPGKIVPTRLRNAVYDFVAARRYGWFGKRDQCMMPEPDLRERFLAGGPGAGESDD
jgi:predicted DCC family thiol-disulfide oxidoreductase YuxK